MRLLVLLELGADVRIPPQLDPRSGRVREQWLVREIDPGSARALDLALRLKEAGSATEVTVIHLGPPLADPWLRSALARGCDRAVRIWDEDGAGVHAAGKAVILAAAAQMAGFDLCLCGVSGVINGSGQLGVLLAGHLGVPCLTQVVDVVAADDPEGAEGRVEVVRGLDAGFGERLEALLPVVMTVNGGPAAEVPPVPAVTAASLLAAQTRQIVVWDLADLGVPREQVRQAERLLRHGDPKPVVTRLRPIAAPDPSLPAFDRILALIQGSVQRREGRVIQRPPDTIVDEIFQTLESEGWLDHLRPGGDPPAPRADDPQDRR